MPIIWDISNEPEDRQRLWLAALSGDKDWIKEEREKLSDLGSKETIDNVYKERNLCVALIASYAQWFGHHVGIKTHQEGDKEWGPEWMHVLFIDLPTGQVSWHLHISEIENFPGIGPYIGEWDGHTTEEKYQRVKDFIRLGKDGPPLLMTDEQIERLGGSSTNDA